MMTTDILLVMAINTIVYALFSIMRLQRHLQTSVRDDEIEAHKTAVVLWLVIGAIAVLAQHLHVGAQR